MHVMFIHPNFPAQFGMPAHFLTTRLGWHCTYVTSIDTTGFQLPFTHINYRLVDDAPQPKVFQNPDSLHALLEHTAAIYRGLRGVPQLSPDLVVGHMSYGTMLYLRDLYNCPFVGYFETFPARFWGDGLVLRKEFPPPDVIRLANATYHTLTLLHLHACDACYTPTHYQASLCPPEWRHKMHVVPEGVDCEMFQPRQRPAAFRDRAISADTKVVTYVSRGLESVRGFDIFMRVAKRIAQARPDVLFLVAGTERTNHGHEQFHIGQTSFKQWVLSQDSYDLERFVFTDALQVPELPALFNLSDLHIHLTVPHLPSPSLLPAMASGCAILGSAGEPVKEFIEHGKQGVLADFYDVDGLTEQALGLLEQPEEARRLGQAARERALEEYELGKCLVRLAEFLQRFDRRRAAADEAFAGLG